MRARAHTVGTLAVVPILVALDMPGGPAFVDALRRVWDAGDAATPLDRRLPPPARTAALAALAPGAVVGPDGERRTLTGGRPVDPGDALVLATSGSTGEPKGVVLTHAAVAASAEATSARLGVDPTRDCWVACLPLAHVGGLSVICRSLHTGTPVEVLDGFDAVTVTAAARRARADGRRVRVALVTAALARVDPGAFHTILLGGAAPPGSPPPNAVVTYGMTETGSGLVYDGVPLDGAAVAIGDGTLGAPGEVLVRGPMLLRAYRDGTVPLLDGGWLPTGDAGALDSDGRLHVHGRMAEVIVTGGEKVWPVAVERVLAGHSAVAEVAVAGWPDPEWGQRVVAHVVPATGALPPTLDELRELVKAHLGSWSAPRDLVLVTSLPRTPSGKVRRSALAGG